MKVTILDIFRELNSFVDCSPFFEKATYSEINTESSDEFKQLVRDWAFGVYDEDVNILVSQLEGLL